MAWGFSRGMQMLREMMVPEAVDFFDAKKPYDVGAPFKVESAVIGGYINHKQVGPTYTRLIPDPVAKPEFIIGGSIIFKKRAARIIYGKEGENMFI